MGKQKQSRSKRKNTKKALINQEPGISESTKFADAGQAGQISVPGDDQVLSHVANFLAGKWIKLKYQDWCSVLRMARNPRSDRRSTEELTQKLTDIVAGSESRAASWLGGIT